MKALILLMVPALINSLICCSDAHGAVPQIINYQARLTDNAGNPLNGTYSLTFGIYALASGGAPLWAETQPAVLATDGFIATLLGSVNPIPGTVFQGAERYLGISIGAGPELTPRKRIATSAYAFKSLWADSANYALSAPGGGDSHWVVADSVLQTSKLWGLARGGAGNITYGDSSHTMVNFGTFSTTGSNEADYRYCTVGGGRSNIAGHSWTTVAGGRSNQATGEGATIGGGQFNDATETQATIGGGIENYATGGAATVAGGYMNTASGNCSAIGGGNSNLTTGSYSAIGGGSDNEANGYYSSVAGGKTNYADSIGSTVGGGWHNNALGLYSAVGGGYGNTAARSRSSVCGGDSNSAGGVYAFVGGGQKDSATADWTTVGGGRSNVATSSYATVAGGCDNRCLGSWSAIAGGSDNLASGTNSCIPGGDHNTAGGYASMAAGVHVTADGYASMAAGAYVNVTIGAGYTFAFGRAFTTSAANAVIFHNSIDPIKMGVGTPDPKVQLEVNDMARIGGDTYPTSGKGMELAFNPDNNTALIQSYDRDSSLWGLLALNASRVGISTTAPTEKLDVNGKLRIRTVEAGTGTDIIVDAGGVIKKVSSSRRYKEHIEPLSSDPERALQLQPVRFEWKNTGEQDIGLIAEEVAKVLPELVINDPDQRPDAVKYDRITLYLLQLVKAQQGKIEALEKRLENLESK